MPKISSDDYISLLEREKRRMRRALGTFDHSTDRLIREDAAIELSLHIRKLLIAKSHQEPFLKKFCEHFWFRLMVFQKETNTNEELAELVRIPGLVFMECPAIYWFLKYEKGEMSEICTAASTNRGLTFAQEDLVVFDTIAKSVCLIADKQGAHIDDDLSENDFIQLNQTGLWKGELSPSYVSIAIIAHQCLVGIDKCLNYIKYQQEDQHIEQIS